MAAMTSSSTRRWRASRGDSVRWVGRQSRRAASIPTASAGAPRIAATGPFRSATSVMAIPRNERMLIHHGTRHRPKIAVAAMKIRNGQCAGSWKSGDCHSLMFAMPQSPAST